MVTHARIVVGLALAARLVAGCDPDLAEPTTRVTAPRLLAVEASPAEVAPGATVALHALWASPDGATTAAPLDWAFCTARKPFTENGPVDPACLVAEAPELVPFGTGVDASGTVPADACRRFGPDRPDAAPGAPPGRPADPDGTGGYFQPVRVRIAGGDLGGGDAYALVPVRIRCGLPGATLAQLGEYRRRSRPNGNPVVTETLLARDGVETALVPLAIDPAARATVRAGEAVHLIVRWPGCPASPTCGDGLCGGDEDDAACSADCASPSLCQGGESYAWFDPEARTVATRREGLRASWFASGGDLALAHTGRAEGAAESSTENVWTAPTTIGPAWLWIVLRDDRGGTSWVSYGVDVVP